MPSVFYLNNVALAVTTVLATALVLMVLGAGPKRPLHRSFALFALLVALAAVFNILRHLSLWLGVGNPLLFTELMFPASIATGPMLGMFTTLYLDRRTRRTDWFVGLGLAATVILCIPLFRHQLFANVYLDDNGIARADSNVWRVIAVQLATVYFVWSLVLFWQERRRIGEGHLGLGVFIFVGGHLLDGILRPSFPITSLTAALSVAVLGHGIVGRQLFNPLRELTQELERKVQERTQALEMAYAEVETRVEERTAELQRAIAEHERLQQEVIQVQQRAIQELSTPVIPLMNTPQGGIVVMPLVGSIDSVRARDITRKLLAGIREHQAEVAILDVTGVPVLDSAVADHLNRAIRAAQLKGARTIITGISNAVTETIVDLGIDWEGIETVADLQTGLRTALAMLGWRVERSGNDGQV